MPFLYTIDKPTTIDLNDFSTDHADSLSKDEAANRVVKLGEQLDSLQESLYAASSHSVLIVLQAMDTAGKDGTVSHVFDSVNPQGCGVTAFKQPTPIESAHDFLWRAHQSVPAKGMMQIFNRSHYEDVLVVRVHDLVPKSVWSKRFDDINYFEANLTQGKTIILKFFLHITKEEQGERLLDREEDSDKAWKLSAADWKEREYWDEYMDAYADTIGKTGTAHAPWYIVPSNHKWYRNHAIADKLVDVLGKYQSEWESELETLGKANKAALYQFRVENPKMAREAEEIRKRQKHEGG